MADFATQSGTEARAPSAGALTVSITAVASWANAFVRLTSVHHGSNGTTAEDPTTTYKNRDLGATVTWADGTLDEFTITPYSSGTTEEMQFTWELVEYTGASGGENEFIVRAHGEETMAGGTGTADVDLSSAGISDLSKCVPVLCGQRHGGGVSQGRRAFGTLEMVAGTPDLRVKREAATNQYRASYAVVEFTGSANTVENNIEHQFQLVATTETEAITDVGDWGEALIFHSFRTQWTSEQQVSYIVAKGDTTSAIQMRIPTTASPSFPAGEFVMCHVVQNPNWSVQHLGWKGASGASAYAAGDNEINYTISAVDLTRASSIGSAYNGGAGATYPASWFGSTFVDSTTARMRRGRDTGDGALSLQVLEWPDVAAVFIAAGSRSESAVAGSEGSQPAVAGSQRSEGAVAGSAGAQSAVAGSRRSESSVAGSMGSQAVVG